VKIDIVPGIAGFHLMLLICLEFSENQYSASHSRLPCSVVDLLCV